MQNGHAVTRSVESEPVGLWPASVAVAGVGHCGGSRVHVGAVASAIRPQTISPSTSSPILLGGERGRTSGRVRLIGPGQSGPDRRHDGYREPPRPPGTSTPTPWSRPHMHCRPPRGPAAYGRAERARGSRRADRIRRKQGRTCTAALTRARPLCRGRAAELTRASCRRRADSDAAHGRGGGAGPGRGAAGLLRLRTLRSPTWCCRNAWRRRRACGSEDVTAVGARGRDQHVTAGGSLTRGLASLGLAAETRRERRRHRRPAAGSLTRRGCLPPS